MRSLATALLLLAVDAGAIELPYADDEAESQQSKQRSFWPARHTTFQVELQSDSQMANMQRVEPSLTYYGLKSIMRREPEGDFPALPSSLVEIASDKVPPPISNAVASLGTTGGLSPGLGLEAARAHHNAGLAERFESKATIAAQDSPVAMETAGFDPRLLPLTSNTSVSAPSSSALGSEPLRSHDSSPQMAVGASGGNGSARAGSVIVAANVSNSSLSGILGQNGAYEGMNISSAPLPGSPVGSSGVVSSPPMALRNASTPAGAAPIAIGESSRQVVSSPIDTTAMTVGTSAPTNVGSSMPPNTTPTSVQVAPWTPENASSSGAAVGSLDNSSTLGRGVSTVTVSPRAPQASKVLQPQPRMSVQTISGGAVTSQPIVGDGVGVATPTDLVPSASEPLPPDHITGPMPLTQLSASAGGGSGGTVGVGAPADPAAASVSLPSAPASVHSSAPTAVRDVAVSRGVSITPPIAPAMDIAPLTSIPTLPSILPHTQMPIHSLSAREDTEKAVMVHVWTLLFFVMAVVVPTSSVVLCVNMYAIKAQIGGEPPRRYFHDLPHFPSAPRF